MRGHADLRRRNVEDELHHDDGSDVLQARASAGQMTMQEKISTPGTDDAHDAARCSDNLPVVNQAQPGHPDNARARTKAGDEIAKEKSRPADGSFQSGAEDVEREHIEKKVQH